MKGFRDATVAEICKRAGANIAAVNYYFGSKEAIYQEAWRHFFAESSKAHPQDGGVGETAPAEERLRGQMKALIRRIADDNNKDFFISQMEFVNPTGLLALVMQTEFIPLREKTLAVLRELLGTDASEEQVVCCETCIISMCIHPVLMQRAQQRIADMEAPFVIADLEAFAEQVVTFALAGIAAIKTGAGAVGLAVQPPCASTL
jgi:TetR/AcrR family transcriptional regulator, regulator of cefoperazone and chloramphenicol sensitivity